LVTRFFFVGFGKQFAEIGELELLDHGRLPSSDTLCYRKSRYGRSAESSLGKSTFLEHRTAHNLPSVMKGAELRPRSGLRFSRDPCAWCPYIGMYSKLDLTKVALVRRPGGDGVGWLDELQRSEAGGDIHFYRVWPVSPVKCGRGSTGG
jgi:hypothetical protein